MSEWGCVSGEGEECMCELRMVEGDIACSFICNIDIVYVSIIRAKIDQRMEATRKQRGESQV